MLFNKRLLFRSSLSRRSILLEDRTRRHDVQTPPSQSPSKDYGIA